MPWREVFQQTARRKELVFDPFVGSGTTIIAAEKTSRFARAIEIDPIYVDVSIRRWQELTGGIAVNGKVIVSPPSVKNVAYVSLDQPPFAGRGSQVPSPYVVPVNSYFVLGDNSTIANDSRMWGAVPRTNIIGQAILR